jgi:hypothetical protein
MHIYIYYIHMYVCVYIYCSYTCINKIIQLYCTNAKSLLPRPLLCRTNGLVMSAKAMVVERFPVFFWNGPKIGILPKYIPQ